MVHAAELKVSPRNSAGKMPPGFVMGCLLMAVTILSGCTILEDNGTHLAFALEHGARELRASTLSEYIVRYEPLEGINETYEITLQHSREVVRVDAFGNTLNHGGGYLTVTGRHNGGTNYHERYVFTPRDLHIVKTNAPTEVVLRKVGDRIDVVELR
jgi:hypothetical protein